MLMIKRYFIVTSTFFDLLKRSQIGIFSKFQSILNYIKLSYINYKLFDFLLNLLFFQSNRIMLKNNQPLISYFNKQMIILSFQNLFFTIFQIFRWLRKPLQFYCKQYFSIFLFFEVIQNQIVITIISMCFFEIILKLNPSIYTIIFYRPVYLILKTIKEMQVRDLPSEERQFEADLDKLIKDIRHFQDHFVLLSHNILKIMHANETQEGLFVNEDISNYRAVIQKVSNITKQIETYYSVLIQKYRQIATVDESSNILMKRVVYRILQIIFNGTSPLNNKIPIVFHDYLRFKMNCQRIVQESFGNKAFLLFKLVTDYQLSKINKYLALFSQLTNHLEDGDLDSFLKSQIGQLLQRKIVSQSKSSNTNNCSSILKMNKIKIRQKPSSKPQINTPPTDKLRTSLPRKGRAYFQCLKDVMEVSRQDFYQQYNCYTENTKQQLYRDLLTRNKVNHHLICEFQQKKRKISQRIKSRRTFKDAKSQIDGDLQIIKEQYNPANTTCKNLLLKLKSDKNSKILPSQLFRKTSKFEDVRVKVRSHQKNEEKTNNKIEEQRRENEEDPVEITTQQNSETLDQKLPILNKRAHSVDQNYKIHVEGDQNQVRTLSNSLKINEDLKLKARMEKLQMQPARIKLELKSVNLLASLQVNKKLCRLGEINKYLYF